MAVPPLRVTSLNTHSVRGDGDYVLYWMVMARRSAHNFALERAVELANELGKPLVVFEALRAGYRWASVRHHTFVLEGMLDNARAFESSKATYLSFVEREEDGGKGLVEALSQRACAIVTDEFPCFFIPRMTSALASRVDVKMEQVDTNGLLPMRATERVFPSAHTFRRFLQKTLPAHLPDRPSSDPLAQLRSAELPDLAHLKRWNFVTAEWLEAGDYSACPVPTGIGAGIQRGGRNAALERWSSFKHEGLVVYHESRNQPDVDAASRLSPYLHFGHVSAHEVFWDLADDEGFELSQLPEKASGSRAGWWKMSEHAESFIDELITWREVGYNFCHLRSDYDQWESLPEWARKSLKDHEGDEREWTYTLDEFAQAKTHDELWNAAQRELVETGRMHNYLRMLWAKKVLHWTKSPQDALAILIELNNRYALDGRNPNSYSGIFWCFGRYDRAWGPERPIFGKIRYMTSASTRRKLKLKNYLKRFGDTPSLF